MKRGEMYYVKLNSQSQGSEQKGVRPAVIIQNDKGNIYSPTTIVALVTSKFKNMYMPTHVEVKSCNLLKEDSVIMLEQIITISKKRISGYIGTLSESKMKQLDEALKISVGLKGEYNHESFNNY